MCIEPQLTLPAPGCDTALPVTFTARSKSQRHPTFRWGVVQLYSEPKDSRMLPQALLFIVDGRLEVESIQDRSEGKTRESGAKKKGEGAGKGWGCPHP